MCRKKPWDPSYENTAVYFFRSLKKKNPVILAPILPLGFITGYQYDAVYGDKMQRIRGKAILWMDSLKFEKMSGF